MSSVVDRQKIFTILVLLLLCLFFYETAHHNYLLFHSTIELFSVFVAFGIFVIAWNTRDIIDNSYFQTLGIAFLFIGILDLLHTFSYKGMGIFPSYGANLPTQLWIASGYILSITFFIAPLLIGKSLRIYLIYIIYSSLTLLTVFSIFIWNIFPVCYIDGVGLTPFKKFSEYIICFFLVAAVFSLFKKRRSLEPSIVSLITVSLVLSIFSHLAFTFYISVYGVSNIIGHLFKLLSFYCIYLALIKTGLKEPFNLLYRNLKHSEERFRLLAETSPIGICLSDENQLCQYVNDKWMQMTGIKISDAIGMPCEQGIHPDDRSRIADYTQNISASNEAESIEYRFLSPDGQTTWVYGFTAAMKNEAGDIQGYMRTVTDITDRKIAEEKLHDLSKKIKNFSYSITHDLKNPVSVISWLASSLKSSYGQTLDDKGREFCEIIMSLSKELFTLIEKINTYIATGENQLNSEKFRLNEITSSLKDEFEPLLAKKKVQLKIQADQVDIKADKLSIIRSLRNLVENAYKYGGDRLSEIKIGYRENGHHHLLYVSDDGAGINPDESEEIFSEFKRASSASGIQGSGLGLSIVKEVAVRHGGNAWHENNDGKWTTFYLSIQKQI